MPGRMKKTGRTGGIDQIFLLKGAVTEHIKMLPVTAPVFWADPKPPHFCLSHVHLLTQEGTLLLCDKCRIKRILKELPLLLSGHPHLV